MHGANAIGNGHIHSINTGYQCGNERMMVMEVSRFNTLFILLLMMLAKASSVLLRILV